MDSAAIFRARSTSSTHRATAKPDEESKAKAQGIEWTRFLVGYDGITLVINPKNTFVKSMTVEQLKKLWQPGLQGQDMEGPRSFLARPQDHPLLPRQRLGHVRVLHRGDLGKAKSQRDDVQQAPTTTRWSAASPATPTGIGYFGYAYYAANKEQAHEPLPVQNGPDAKPVLPSPETIARQVVHTRSRGPCTSCQELGAADGRTSGGFLKYYLETSRSSRSRAATIRRPRTIKANRIRWPDATRQPSGTTPRRGAQSPAQVTRDDRVRRDVRPI